MLREVRKEIEGLADLLRWGAVIDDGIVMQWDGSLMAAWKYPILERLEAFATSATGSPGRSERARSRHSTDCRNLPTEAFPVPCRIYMSPSDACTEITILP